MAYRIEEFLDKVAFPIVQRGEGYFEDDMVQRVTKSGNTYTAKVSGSGYRPYHVEITFNEAGEVESWECDCPYDWGDVCKHTVAALLAIRDGDYKETGPSVQKEGTSGSSLARLLDQAGPKAMKELILQHCKKDEAFCLEVLSSLSGSGGEELAAVKRLIQTSIKKNTSYQGLDDHGCSAICRDMRNALNKARRRMEQEQYPQALDIALYVLQSCGELYDEYLGEETTLINMIEAALEFIGTCMEAFSRSPDAAAKNKQLNVILETAEVIHFGDWKYYRYDLIRHTAMLADTDSAGEVYALLDKWKNQNREEFLDFQYILDQDKRTRYYVVAAAEGQAAARSYVEQNLDVDALRLLAVQEDMAQENYANAERLCQERAEQTQRNPYLRPSNWNYLLYEIYQAWGHREEQYRQAQRLVLLGDWSYYPILKNYLQECGQWEEKYPELREEIHTARPKDEYIRLLADEKETDLLMEQIRVRKEMVFQYGALLMESYSSEVYTLCTEWIQKSAEPTSNRKHYQELCGKIKKLSDFGGKREALALINELAQKYPRRRVLLEELKLIRERLR